MKQSQNGLQEQPCCLLHFTCKANTLYHGESCTYIYIHRTSKAVLWIMEFDMHSNWRDASHFKLRNVVFSELIVNAFALTISRPIYYRYKINDTFYILSLLSTAFLFIYILTYNALIHDVQNVKRFSFSKCKSIQTGKVS